MRGARRPGGEPFAELCRKVVVLITEDWFALSHFRPLIALLQGGRARGRRHHPLVGPPRRDRGARRARHRLRLSPLLEQPGAGGRLGLGACAHPRGGGARCRASGGHEAGGAGRPRAQARALPPRGRAHDRARPARVRHGRAAAALPRRGAAPDGLDAAPAGLVPAGRERRRSGAAARARRRPRRAVCHPGRRRRRPAGVSGPAAARPTTCRSRPSSAA